MKISSYQPTKTNSNPSPSIRQSISNFHNNVDEKKIQLNIVRGSQYFFVISASGKITYNSLFQFPLLAKKQQQISNCEVSFNGYNRLLIRNLQRIYKYFTSQCINGNFSLNVQGCVKNAYCVWNWIKGFLSVINVNEYEYFFLSYAVQLLGILHENCGWM